MPVEHRSRRKQARFATANSHAETTSPPAAFRPGGTAAAAFPEPHRRYRPRGNCAPHSGGHRAAPRGRRHQGFLVAAARGFDQPGVAAAGRARAIMATASSADHGAHRTKPKNPVMILYHSGSGDQIAEDGLPGRPRILGKAISPSCFKPARDHRSAPDRPHRPLPARQILAIKHSSSFDFTRELMCSRQ